MQPLFKLSHTPNHYSNFTGGSLLQNRKYTYVFRKATFIELSPCLPPPPTMPSLLPVGPGNPWAVECRPSAGTGPVQAWAGLLHHYAHSKGSQMCLTAHLWQRVLAVSWYTGLKIRPKVLQTKHASWSLCCSVFFLMEQSGYSWSSATVLVSARPDKIHFKRDMRKEDERLVCGTKANKGSWLVCQEYSQSKTAPNSPPRHLTQPLISLVLRALECVKRPAVPTEPNTPSQHTVWRQQRLRAGISWSPGRCCPRSFQLAALPTTARDSALAFLSLCWLQLYTLWISFWWQFKEQAARGKPLSHDL